MKKVLGLLTFLLSNFGPLLAFYIGNHFWGIRAGVIATVVWTVGEITFNWIYQRKTSTFFKFSASIAIVFGLIDVYLQQSVFFKYEGALSNVMVGLFFASSLFGEKSIIQEFAEAQGRVSGTLSPDAQYYFKFLTVVWTVYQFAKAAFYAWVAAHYTLEEGLVFRALVGNVTFYALLGISIFGSRPIIKILAKLGMLPSTRAGYVPAVAPSRT